MTQKTTWMHYLITGIIKLILFTFIVSCESEIDYVVKADFIYNNNTNHVIYLESTATLNPNESLKISFESDGSKNVTESSYVPPYPFNEGNIIKYDNLKCDTLDPGVKVGQGEGPSGIQNYKSKKIAERYYEFGYNFTDEDYNRAGNCE